MADKLFGARRGAQLWFQHDCQQHRLGLHRLRDRHLFKRQLQLFKHELRLERHARLADL